MKKLNIKTSDEILSKILFSLFGINIISNAEILIFLSIALLINSQRVLDKLIKS